MRDFDIVLKNESWMGPDCISPRNIFTSIDILAAGPGDGLELLNTRTVTTAESMCLPSLSLWLLDLSPF